jgi:hypothetical protein
MRNTILIGLVCFIFFGCKKDKYSSTPQLTYKSVNVNPVLPNEIVKFVITVTDAEGDISNSLFVQKVSLNCGASNFSAPYPVPDFPSNSNLKTDISVSFSNGGNNQGYINIANCIEPADTCYFRFVLTDKANHVSDTIKSETIVILK